MYILSSMKLISVLFSQLHTE